MTKRWVIRDGNGAGRGRGNIPRPRPDPRSLFPAPSPKHLSGKKFAPSLAPSDPRTPSEPRGEEQWVLHSNEIKIKQIIQIDQRIHETSSKNWIKIMRSLHALVHSTRQQNANTFRGAGSCTQAWKACPSPRHNDTSMRKRRSGLALRGACWLAARGLRLGDGESEMRTQEQDEEWRALGGGGRLIGMRLGFAGGRRKVIYVFVGLSGCYFKWATITRGSPWCPRGEKFAPRLRPDNISGPRPASFAGEILPPSLPRSGRVSAGIRPRGENCHPYEWYMNQNVDHACMFFPNERNNMI
jgi:hypothetical protein